MTYQLVLTSEQGEELHCKISSVKPLAFSDLPKDNQGKLEPLSIELSGEVAGLIAGDNLSGDASVELPKIKFKEPIEVFALVDGGWLPPPFSLLNNLIIDKNVASSLMQLREKANNRSDINSRRWWLDFLNSDEITFNPILYGLEGNRRRHPSFCTFKKELKSATQELRHSFPCAKITEYSGNRLIEAYQVAKIFETRFESEKKFLIDSINLVASRIPNDRELSGIEDQILSHATRHDLSLSSLVVVTVLSCLYRDKRGNMYSPGLKVLENRRIADPSEQAYNALFDLRSLELLLGFQAHFKDEKFGLCTCDKGIAGLWCGLSPYNVKPAIDGDGAQFEFRLTAGLFPRLSDDGRQRLKERIVNR